ncbi:CD99 antigen-like protein 2 isoform X3 [Oryctolagus cuniculus]|nr:CD99 antigen-like protein 2 isoform X1 [Oryctolagus cuniculus]
MQARSPNSPSAPRPRLSHTSPAPLPCPARRLRTRPRPRPCRGAPRRGCSRTPFPRPLWAEPHTRAPPGRGPAVAAGLLLPAFSGSPPLTFWRCAPLGPLCLLPAMVARRSAILVCLAFSLVTLTQRGSGVFGDDFSLEDALEETSSVKQRWDHITTTTTRRPGTTRAPANPAGDDFDLSDALGDRDDGRKKPSAGGGGGGGRWDHITTTTTRRPGTTRAPANPAVDDFDLSDALDDRNDRDDGRRKPSAGGGGGFSDKDLEDVLGGGEYKPDKNKGDGGYGSTDDSGSGMSAETGTIAGVASALAMALIGAVSSYISYQQKKFCFSIQQGLNADYVKGENLEAVVCEEPQVKYSALQTQSVEPSAPEPPRI